MTKSPFALSLGVDADDLVSCVACGLCLPHCPTYRVTLDEAASPRGRIALMNEVDRTGVADDYFIEYMNACIQCRGCETACPAGVPFGSMMEQTREALVEQSDYQPRWRRVGYWFLGRPRLLRVGSSALAVLQKAHLIPKRLGLPPLTVTRPRLRSSGDDVIIFTGCVMDAWMRDTHVATVEVLERLGLKVRISGSDAPVLRRAASPCRSWGSGTCQSPRDDRGASWRCSNTGQLRRLWCPAEELRRVARR